MLHRLKSNLKDQLNRAKNSLATDVFGIEKQLHTHANQYVAKLSTIVLPKIKTGN